MTKEFVFFTNLCKNFLEDASPPFPSISNLTPSELNNLPEIAESHRLLPVLNQYADILPDTVAEQTRKMTREETQRTLKKGVELLRLTEHFNSHNIPFTTLKGIPLSVFLYEDMGKRHSRDIDLLVNKRDLENGLSILFKLGYQKLRPEFPLKGKPYAYFKKFKSDIVLFHPSKEIVLEVHFTCFWIPDIFQTDEKVLIDRSSSIKIKETEVPLLNSVYLLPYLCSHGAKHQWKRLFWLLDIGILLRKLTVNEWEQATDLIEKQGLQRPLTQALLLLKQLFDFELSGDFTKPESDRITPKIAAKAMNRLKHPDYKPDFNDRIDELIYKSRLKSDIVYKIKLLVHIATIAPADWHRFPLPDALFALYFPLRPLLWMWRKRESPTNEVT